MGYYFDDDAAHDLIHEISAMQALDDIGVDMKRSGSNYLILCPNPNHNDRSLGSCVVMPNKGGRCHCYACGREISSLDVFMWMNGMSYYESMCRLAELSGHPEDYEAKGKIKKQQPKKKRLKPNQLKLIGLSSQSGVKMVTNASPYKSDAPKMVDKNEDYLLYNRTAYGIHRLQDEDPETFAWLVRNKCKEKMLSLDLLQSGLKDPNSTETSVLAYALMKKNGISLRHMIDTIKSLYREVETIYYEYGGNMKDPLQRAASILTMSLQKQAGKPTFSNVG